MWLCNKLGWPYIHASKPAAVLLLPLPSRVVAVVTLRYCRMRVAPAPAKLSHAGSNQASSWYPAQRVCSGGTSSAAGLSRGQACDAHWLLHGCTADIPCAAGAVPPGGARLCGECHPAGGAIELQVSCIGVPLPSVALWVVVL